MALEPTNLLVETHSTDVVWSGKRAINNIVNVGLGLIAQYVASQSKGCEFDSQSVAGQLNRTQPSILLRLVNEQQGDHCRILQQCPDAH